MANTFRGELINQTLPTVNIKGSVSGDFTVNPALTVAGNSGIVGVTNVDTGRVVKHNHTATVNAESAIPVITGTATVTITAANGTRVHYTLNGRNPTSKAAKKSTADSVKENARMNRSRMGAARVYEDAFTIENSRPGSDKCIIRIRSYKTANEEIGGKTVAGISPNEKSKVLIIRFILKNHSW